MKSGWAVGAPPVLSPFSWVPVRATQLLACPAQGSGRDFLQAPVMKGKRLVSQGKIWVLWE